MSKLFSLALLIWYCVLHQQSLSGNDWPFVPNILLMSEQHSSWHGPKNGSGSKIRSRTLRTQLMLTLFRCVSGCKDWELRISSLRKSS